ncbi:RHS repeat-associated core domain-containing protein [Amycolatopsis japonica]|uniref:RHS repeat-associated core domain-containing protein n=1 Tax=Amycolatopsis japonica TaxID=208439 RepID=UPI0033F89C60
MRHKPSTRRTSRTLTVALICSLVVTGVSTTQIASAANGWSVASPEVNSTPVAKQTMKGRELDDASRAALTGNQPAGSTTPDGGGTSSATSLSPSATWDVSKQTGDFTWSYPLRVPPAPGDLQPNLALSYNSSTVDGRTSATNNQASWVGDGWDLHPGFVERTYGSCQDDKEGGTTPPKVGDLCWKSDNATAVYNGSGGMLIHDTDKKEWRQKSDNGSRIEHLTGASNGARDGEYWKISTVDGTQYFFGSAAVSKSTWTVPVYGDDVGEPCHAADNKFDNSACTQAYRWNLDKVVDRHGNLILYSYDIETNNYGQNVKDTAVSYVRGGTLKEIQYGLHEGDPAPATGKVTFVTEERCVPGSVCTLDKTENFPDVALADRCDGPTCKDHYSPTFWSTKRLAKITTQVRAGTGYTDVDSWTLEQQFPNPDDGNKAALWLKSITHTGHVGTPITLPKVTFEGKKLPNRVVKEDGVGHLNRYRLSAIVSEAGGVTTINYAPADCSATSLPDKPETNTKRCFPVTWTKRDFAERTDYFHKYVVGSVVQSDWMSTSSEQVTNYEYPEGAAWHYTTSEFAPEKDKTWNEFRGFGKVIVRTGRPENPSGPIGYSETRYFRGMHSDKLPNNGTRSVSIPDSEGGSHVDEDWLQGLELEGLTKNGEGGAVVGKTITEPSWQGPTATRGAYKAYIVRAGTQRSFTALAAGGWRTTKTTTDYDPNGLPTKVNDHGDLNVTGDERCTSTTYAQNTDRWLLNFPSRVETLSTVCGFLPVYPRDTISDVRSSYDTLAPGVPPTVGDVTLAEEVDGYNGFTPVYRTVAKTKRDIYGRAIEITDADGNAATSSYTPATSGPVTQLVTANALGHKTTTVYEPAWGSARTITDPNNRVMEISYDALGRKAEVWQPNRPRADYPTEPSGRFTYDVRNNAPSSITSMRFGPKSNYVTSTTILDGLYRTRQVQTPAPGGGRLLVDTRYDSQGRAYKTTQPYYNDQPVDTSLWVASDTEVPGLTLTDFDGAGRAIASTYQGGTTEWITRTTYNGDSVSVTPPEGGSATTTITDARGRTRALRQHHGAQPTDAYDETKYDYTNSDKLAAITDSSGNRWSYTYDIHGSLIRTDDPDRGATTYQYNKLNQQISSTDARNVTLAFRYDKLGRKTGVFKDTLGGTKLSEWAYDTAVKGIGQPASSTRWVDGNAYVNKVINYDPLYQPLNQSVVIPPIEGPKLAGTYQTSLAYKEDGSLGAVGYPKAGDLSSETVAYTQDELNNVLTADGGVDDDFQTYVSETEYTRYGEPQRFHLGGSSSTATNGKRAWLSFYYDTNTRRLDRTIVDAEVPQPMQTDTRYSYNPAGNITAISNAPIGQPADKQCFGYDYLQRLTEAWTPASTDCGAPRAVNVLGGPAPYWQSYSYDKSGNRIGDTQHVAGGDITRKYSYAAPGTPKPHLLNAVTSEGPAGSKTAQYTYDELGNTKTRPGTSGQQNLDWNVENKLEKVTDGTADTTFLYDADGSRLIRRDPTGTTLYLGPQEVRLDKASGNATTTRYYSHGGLTIAMRKSGALTWLAGDHQGTTQVAINASDLTVKQRRQTPFGAERGPSAGMPGERGFVGGTIDASTGLTTLGARSYDADLGRFISLDPIMDPSSPQQINGYSYSINNPIAFSDPSGLAHEDSPGYCVGWRGDCGIDPRVGNDINGHYTPEQLEQKGVKKGQSKSKRKDWEKKNAPSSRKRSQVLAEFDKVLNMGTLEYWNFPMPPNVDPDTNICFGKLACEKARDYLLAPETENDVEGAKLVAATYCVDHFDECAMAAGIAATVQGVLAELFSVVGGAMSGGVSRSGGAEGRAPGSRAVQDLVASGIPVRIGSVEVGAGGNVSAISISEQTRIQNVANRIGKPVSLVGSRARGSATPISDWDYVIEGINSRTRSRIRTSLPAGDVTLGPVQSRLDIFNGPLNQNQPFITFYPR